jgi:hypothetical protein
MPYLFEVMPVFGAGECGDGLANRSAPVASLVGVAKRTHIAGHAGQETRLVAGKQQ